MFLSVLATLLCMSFASGGEPASEFGALTVPSAAIAEAELSKIAAALKAPIEKKIKVRD